MNIAIIGTNRKTPFTYPITGNIRDFETKLTEMLEIARANGRPYMSFHYPMTTFWLDDFYDRTSNGLKLNLYKRMRIISLAQYEICKKYKR